MTRIAKIMMMAMTILFTATAFAQIAAPSTTEPAGQQNNESMMKKDPNQDDTQNKTNTESTQDAQ
jgi:hypothetical protein